MKEGPGWIEVIFGAILSLLLGVVVAAVFLVLKPVPTVKELPKEPVAKMVYYIEGSRDSSKTRAVISKQKVLAQGGSVVLVEDELNAMVVPPPAAPVAKKMELPQPAAEKKAVTPGNPNFRIRDNVMQIAVPVQLSAYEMDYKIILQARGGFAKEGDAVVFQPSELYLGSCPLEKLPAVKEYVLKYLIAKMTLAEDAAAVWKKVTAATVEGSTVHLTTAVQ